MKQQELDSILELHRKWLYNEDGGKRADLTGEDLSFLVMRNADMSGADMSGAVMSGADMRNAVIPDIQCATLSICPQDGSFIAFKKARYRDDEGFRCGCIVKLEIPADAKRSNATSRKCRASKARVISIETIAGDRIDEDVRVFSYHDEDFTYSNGITVEPTEPFDENRWEECAAGIHFFITREEAVAY